MVSEIEPMGDRGKPHTAIREIIGGEQVFVSTSAQTVTVYGLVII